MLSTRKFSIFLALAAVSALACGDTALRSSDEVPGDEGALAPAIAQEAPAALEASADGFRGRFANASSVTATDATAAMWSQQKLIRTGEMRIEVDSVPRAIARVEDLAVRAGGYVADSRVVEGQFGLRTAQLVIRIPTSGFGSTLAAFRGMGKVNGESSTTEDVTRAYADLETRLAVKEQTAERLRQLLASRTGGLNEVLQVERELARVVTEIEQMKGERRYLDQRTSLSTINLTLYEPGTPPSRDHGPVTTALRTSLASLAVSATWVMYVTMFLAPWLLVAAGGWWVIKTVRAMRSV